MAVVWRYRLPAIVVAALCAALAYGYSLTVASEFVATTSVLVDGEALSSGYTRSPATVDPEARLRTLGDRLLSRAALQPIMDRYGLFPEGASWEERLTEMRDRVGISTSGTHAFRISFTHTEPEVARDVANALVSRFIDDSMRARARQSRDTTSMLAGRLETLTRQLGDTDRQIADFKAAHTGSLPDQLSGTLTALDRARARLDRANRGVRVPEPRRSELRARIEELENRLSAAPEVERQILELQRDRDILSRAYEQVRSRWVEASLAGSPEIGEAPGFEVLDPAVTPQRTSSPRRMHYFLGGGLLGLVLVLAGGMAREMILQPVHDAEELERYTGVPVLGSIPAIDDSRRRKRRVLVRAVGIVLAVVAITGVFVAQMLS